MVKERRGLRKKLKRANTDIEKNGFEALLKDVIEQLRKLRHAETRRKK